MFGLDHETLFQCAALVVGTLITSGVGVLVRLLLMTRATLTAMDKRVEAHMQVSDELVSGFREDIAGLRVSMREQHLEITARMDVYSQRLGQVERDVAVLKGRG